MARTGKQGVVALLSELLLAGSAQAWQAEIARDRYGVPYIIADTMADAAFGDGYAQAADRGKEAFELILAATGTSAASLGAGNTSSACPEGKNVCNDMQARLTGVYRTAYAQWTAIPAEVQEIASAFAAGANLWGLENAGELPPGARPLTGQDIIAYAQYTGVARQLLQATKEKAQEGQDTECGEGSNGVVLANSLTGNKGVILQVDPHTPWSGFNRWYEKAYVTPDTVIHGGGPTGLPLFLFATSDRVGWALTRNSGDRGDCFYVTPDPADPLRYMYDGASLPLSSVTETIEVKDSSSVQFEVLSTQHGPIFAKEGGLYYAAAMSMENRTGVLGQMLAMAGADSATELDAAFSMMEIDGAQAMYGDVDGNIGYAWLNRLRDRDDSYYWEYCVDGSISATALGAVLDFASLPGSTNDPGGYYQACNQPDWLVNGGAWGIDPWSYPGWLRGRDFVRDYLGARAQRVVDLIQSRQRHSHGRARKSSLDTALLGAVWMIPVLERAMAQYGDGGDPLVQNAFSELLRFKRKPRATARSRGYALWHEWNGYWVQDAVLGSAPPASPEVSRIREFYDLPDHPETVSDLDLQRAHQAFLDAVAHLNSYYLAGHYDSPLPRWGDINFIQLADGSKYGFGGSDGELQGIWQGSHGGGSCGAFPNPSADGTWTINAGSDFMMSSQLRTLPRLPKVYTLVPYGVSNDPASPHFADQTRRYVKGKYKKVPFGEKDVRRKAKSIVTVSGS
ncbi:MAG: penicillin acylase family protein [Proteobacteria bacterium]|nr:penicillin acylase family protein [Pseudomonadota bacterium]